ncbi:MAG: hypothetical protein WDW36_009587 [Sanguina aurantia]
MASGGGGGGSNGSSASAAPHFSDAPRTASTAPAQHGRRISGGGKLPRPHGVQHDANPPPSAGASLGAALPPLNTSLAQRASYPGAPANASSVKTPGRDASEPAPSSSPGMTHRAASPEHGLSGWSAREEDTHRRSLPGSPKPRSPQGGRSSGGGGATDGDGGSGAQQPQLLLLLLPPIPEVPSNWSVGSLAEKPSLPNDLGGPITTAKPFPADLDGSGSGVCATGSSTTVGSRAGASLRKGPPAAPIAARVAGDEDASAEDGAWLEGRVGRALSFSRGWGEEASGDPPSQHDPGSPDPGVSAFQGTWPPQSTTGTSSHPVSRSQSPNQGFGISTGPNSGRGSPTMSLNRSGTPVGGGGASRPTSVQTATQGAALRGSSTGQCVSHMAPTVLAAGGERGSLSRSRQRSAAGQRRSPSGSRPPTGPPSPTLTRSRGASGGSVNQDSLQVTPVRRQTAPPSREVTVAAPAASDSDSPPNASTHPSSNYRASSRAGPCPHPSSMPTIGSHHAQHRQGPVQTVPTAAALPTPAGLYMSYDTDMLTAHPPSRPRTAVAPFAEREGEFADVTPQRSGGGQKEGWGRAHSGLVPPGRLTPSLMSHMGVREPGSGSGSKEHPHRGTNTLHGDPENLTAGVGSTAGASMAIAGISQHSRSARPGAATRAHGLPVAGNNSLGELLLVKSMRSREEDTWTGSGMGGLRAGSGRRGGRGGGGDGPAAGAGRKRHTSGTLSHPPTYAAVTLSPAAAAAAAAAAAEAEAEATRVMQRILSLPAAAPLQMKGGLLRRLRAAQLSLMGPPPFARRAEKRPESPAGELLDGFLLLEAGDEELPEHILAASLPGRHLSSTEPTDLAYFSSLRDLDLSDNRLPSMACLCTLTSLTRLILGANRMTRVGLAGLVCRSVPVGQESEGPPPGVPPPSAAREPHPGLSPAVTPDGGGVSLGGGRVTGPGSGGGSGEKVAGAGAGPGAVDGEVGVEVPYEMPLQLLQTLDLSFNMLQAEEVLGAGSVLSLLPRLCSMDLSSNGFKRLPNCLGAFPALHSLSLARNSLRASALPPLAALPRLAQLDLSHNLIDSFPDHPLNLSDPRPSPNAPVSQNPPPQHLQPYRSLVTLDLRHNRVTQEAFLRACYSLPQLRTLLLFGNPFELSSAAAGVASRSNSAGEASNVSVRMGDETLERPSLGVLFTAQFVHTPKAMSKAAALASASAAAIASTPQQTVTEVFERTDAAIEAWRLNTVQEEDEEGEGSGPGDDDNTFLTGVGISERSGRDGSSSSSTIGAEGAEVASETADTSGGRPLWADVGDPTERLALALGLDPHRLTIYSGQITTDALASVNSLRFALNHPLVHAEEGLNGASNFLNMTEARLAKYRPKQLAPLPPSDFGSAALQQPAPGTKLAKIQTIERMLSTMKGRLHSLEHNLSKQLANVPPRPSATSLDHDGPYPNAHDADVTIQRPRSKVHATMRANAAAGVSPPLEDLDDLDQDADDSDMSSLPDEVIDAIENDTSSEHSDSEGYDLEDDTAFGTRPPTDGPDRGGVYAGPCGGRGSARVCLRVPRDNTKTP